MKLVSVLAAALATAFGYPAVAESASAIRTTSTMAFVGVHVPSSSGPIDVQVGIEQSEIVVGGETTFSNQIASLSAMFVDPETGLPIFQVGCAFTPDVMVLRPLKEAELRGSAVCHELPEGRDVSFEVDLTWDRLPSAAHFPGGTVRDAIVSGVVVFDGTAVDVDDAVGWLSRFSDTDPYGSGRSETGGGTSGNIDDPAGCFEGGVIGSAFGADVHWARSARGVYHVGGALDLLVVAVTAEGAEYTLTGTARLSESFKTPSANEFGERIHNVSLPVTLVADDGRVVAATYEAALAVNGEQDPAHVSVLGFGVLCASDG